MQRMFAHDTAVPAYRWRHVQSMPLSAAGVTRKRQQPPLQRPDAAVRKQRAQGSHGVQRRCGSGGQHTGAAKAAPLGRTAGPTLTPRVASYEPLAEEPAGFHLPAPADVRSDTQHLHGVAAAWPAARGSHMHSPQRPRAGIAGATSSQHAGSMTQKGCGPTAGAAAAETEHAKSMPLRTRAQGGRKRRKRSSEGSG